MVHGEKSHFGLVLMLLHNQLIFSVINLEKMWGNLDLNQGPTGYESAALTTELLPRDDRMKIHE